MLVVDNTDGSAIRVNVCDDHWNAYCQFDSLAAGRHWLIRLIKTRRK